LTNSYADSCCTCCRRGSSASATSGFWRIAGAALLSRSAYNCSPNQAGFQPKPSRKKERAHLHSRFGFVRTAVGPWSSSHGSAPLSFDCGLRQFPPRNNHDTIFLITTSTPSRTPSPQVCPRRPPHGLETLESPFTGTTSEDYGPSIPLLSSFFRLHRHSKPIARPCQNGFLQVAVSKTLRRSRFQRSRGSPRRSIPDTALRLVVLVATAIARSSDVRANVIGMIVLPRRINLPHVDPNTRVIAGPLSYPIDNDHELPCYSLSARPRLPILTIYRLR